MTYHVHDPQHTQKNIASGETFPPHVIKIDESLLNACPKLREALDEIGMRLNDQYRNKTTSSGSPITGINFISIDITLDLGPAR